MKQVGIIARYESLNWKHFMRTGVQRVVKISVFDFTYFNRKCTRICDNLTLTIRARTRIILHIH